MSNASLTAQAVSHPDSLHLAVKQASARKVLVWISLMVLAGTGLLTYLANAYYTVPLSVFAVWGSVTWLVQRGLKDHPYPSFGMANTITAFRAGSVAVLAGTIPVAEHLAQASNSTGGLFLWFMCTLVVLLLALDGVDGFLARKTGMSSNFGARFDMEVDAFLALVIAAFLWQSDKLGIWVLGLGLMRYAFVLASVWLKPLQAPLFPSIRRKTICVLQITCLCLMLMPLINASEGTIIGSFALLCLSASFLRDIHWLYSSQHNAK